MPKEIVTVELNEDEYNALLLAVCAFPGRLREYHRDGEMTELETRMIEYSLRAAQRKLLRPVGVTAEEIV